MNLIIQSDKNSWIARWGRERFPCAVGRHGVIDALLKREGDGMTPVGSWPMRYVFYRADRFSQAPETKLLLKTIRGDDGWCDASDDPLYNRPCVHPYPASAERLWRSDRLYDLVVVLGYNDEPVRPGKGSAIFLHVASPDYGPTAGCVALSRDHLLRVAREAGPGSCVDVLKL